MIDLKNLLLGAKRSVNLLACVRSEDRIALLFKVVEVKICKTHRSGVRGMKWRAMSEIGLLVFRFSGLFQELFLYLY